MAKPRVFISSTFYDLRLIRSSLEVFIRDLGYEPVLFENGTIAFPTHEELEDGCYREIHTCEILVNIMGGRYGTASSSDDYSITQKELKEALTANKQVYVFIENSVYNEYSTWEANQNLEGISNFKWVSVNDEKIFKFIHELKSLKRQPVITSFDSHFKIFDYLKEQWASLFQHYLFNSTQREEVKNLNLLSSATQTLNNLVHLLSSKIVANQEAVESIIAMNHVLFKDLQEKLNIKYRVFFTNKYELIAWLEAQNFSSLELPGSLFCQRTRKNDVQILEISDELFDEFGNLKNISSVDFKPEWVQIEYRAKHIDDMPF